MKLTNLKVAIFWAFIFFVLAVLTLSHYNINWDTINHLPRGQSYLNFFLTKNRDFSNLPKFEWYLQDPNKLSFSPDRKVNRVSMYQTASGVNFNYFVENDGGHPPVSDILSSFFNLVLFQKLGIINDIDSYRVYGVFLAAALVLLVYYWTASLYGRIAGLISAASLSLYPLFLSETHFNTEKDIPETVYIAFFIYSFIKGVGSRSLRWFCVSGVFLGLALGTKFNVFFAPLILAPWFLIWVIDNFRKIENKKRFVFGLSLVPAIALAIFFVTWPYLWADPIARIGNVISFYKTIGLTTTLDPHFSGIFGVNVYPTLWIVTTTPLLILFLSLLGIIVSLGRLLKGRADLSILFLFWLFVPIARVTFPGTTIYGGVRQIMEYIPALAILAGLGAVVLRSWISKTIRWFTSFNYLRSNLIAAGFVIASFIPIVIKLIQIHPNENVYFNPLIGGLAGARQHNFPFWGMSFGAPYRQGAAWLNENAEKDAKIAYAYELIPNIPRIWLRQDLTLHNQYRSGYLQKGEYVITLTYQGTETRSYFDSYLEKFLEPVYQITVDGVPILKVWKNDKGHLKQRINEVLDKKVLLEKKDFGLRFGLGEARKLWRLEIDYQEGECPALTYGFVQISKDAKTWDRLPGNLPDDWRITNLGQQPKDSHFIEPFVGQEARFIELILNPQDTCLVNVKDFRVFYLD